MTDTDVHWQGPEALRPLLVPLGELDTLPNNPKKGDVAAVARSYKIFGQRKSIVARRGDDGRGTILAGNTQYKACRDVLEWSHIAVVWVDDDDQTAIAYALTDNRTADLGVYDNELLLDALAQVDDMEVRDATGYGQEDIQALLEAVEQEPVIPSDPMGGEPGHSGSNPVVQYAIVFSDEEQQSRWFKFVRWLKKIHPDEDTLADRLDLFLQSILEENEDDDSDDD